MCAPGLRVRKASVIIDSSQAIHNLRPPLSLSHFLPINAIPAGGSVTIESKELFGNFFRMSKESPFISAFFIRVY